MKQFFMYFLRLGVMASLLLGGVQPSAVSHAQSPAGSPFAASATIVTAPPQPYANAWPGKINPGYQYSRSFGESGIPYPPDNQNQNLNNPFGIVLDRSGKLFAVENSGNRLFGFNTNTTPGQLLPWAPYGVAGVQGNNGNPNTVMNNPQQLWSDDLGGKLWVTNWNYISIFDKTSGALLWNISNFNNNGVFGENNFDCLTGIAVDTSTTPWQLLVAETCNKNAVLVFEIENPYSDSPIVNLRKMLQNNNGGFSNVGDVQLIDRSAGPITDKRLFVTHDNGLTEYAANSTDPTSWDLKKWIDQGNFNTRGLALNPTDSQNVYVAANTNNGPAVDKVDIDTLNLQDYISGWNNNTNSANFNDPRDLVFDAVGTMYLSDGGGNAIYQFTSPNDRAIFYGSGIPYSTLLTPSDGHYYYNTPTGVALDANDNVYILENRGQRLTKLSADGTYQWSFGVPGVSGPRESTSMINWPQGNPAVDKNGTVYVPDWNNNRVLLLDQNGAYMGTIGNQPEEFYRFDCPGGVAIGPNGDIYVVDSCANNVQVYDSNRYYRSSFGFKHENGDNNFHFNNPSAVAVRDANTVLVADRNNNRVQECKRTQHGVNTLPNGDPLYKEDWSCKTAVGVTGESANNHPAYLNNPFGIAWDAARQRLLVGDQSAVLIYDQNYKMVGVLGNRQNNSNQIGYFSNINGLALDSSGNLYVADWNSMRVDRFVSSLNPLELAGVNGGSIQGIGKLALPGLDSYLVTGMGSRLAAFNLADPNVPVFAGASELLPGNFKHLVVEGSAAYAQTSDDYLRIFSFADPTKPTQVAEMSMIGAQGLAVANGWVFAGSCCAGGNAWQGPRLLAIDARNPAAPSVSKIQILDVNNNWYANEMVAHLDGSHNSIDVYIALQRSGLEKYTFDLDSKTFSAPLHYNESGPSGETMVFNHLALSADGTRLYATTFPDWNPNQGELHTLNTSDLSDAVAFVPTNQGDSPMYLNGSTLYLAGWNNMEVYDTGDLVATQKFVASKQPDLIFGTLLEAGNVLYSAAGSTGLLAFSLDLAQTDETQRASLLSRLQAPAGKPGFLAVDSGIVYAAQQDSGISRFTTADPGKPIETHQVTDQNSNRVELRKVDGHLYAFSLSGYDNGHDKLVVLDGDNPAISKVDSTAVYSDGRGNFNNNGTNLVVLPGASHHALVYIAGVYGGMRVYDVDFTDPNNVVLNFISDTNLNLDSFWNGNTIALSGQYLLIPNQNSGVKAIDLSNTANPIEVAQIPGNPVAVAALNGKAYVYGKDNNFRVYDLSQLGNPTPSFPELGSLNMNGPYNWPNQITLQQFGTVTLAYFAAGDQVIVLDVTDPTAMRILSSDKKSNAWINSGVTVGNFYLASERDMGLYSYWTPPQTQQTLQLAADLLDSSSIDGVQIHLNADRVQAIQLLHAPVYTGNVSATFPSGLQGTGHTFELFARDAAADRSVTSLGAETYTITVQYTDADIAGLSENSLALFYWDGAAWKKDYSSQVDAAQNKVSATPNAFGLWTLAGMADTIGPDGTLAINGGASYSNVFTVTLTLSGLSADADRVRFKEDCAGCTWSGWSDASNPNFPFTLTAGDGLKTVAAEIADAANNKSQAQDMITLDTTSPGGSITITETNPTRLNQVHLDLSGITDAGSGLYQVELSADPAFAGATWQAYGAAAVFSLSGADGTKTIYARFSDQAGNITSAEMKASIVLDATAPTGTLVILGTGEPTITRDVSLVLTGSDNLTGVSQMRLSENSAFTGVSWVSYTAITPFTLSTGDGLKTVYAQLRDLAGNISSIEITDTIMLDTTAPTGGLSIAQKPYTTNATVNLSLSGSGAATMRLANTSAGLSAAAWESFAASKTGWALDTPTTDGLKTVFVQYKDGSGNLSPIYEDATLLDTTAPAGELYINGGLSLTAAPSVSLFLTFTEAGSGISQVQVASNSSMSGATWTAFANPISFSLTGGDGVKTVYIKLKDNAGNVSQVISDTITLDSAAPTGSILITAGSQTFYSHQVALTLSAADEISPAADLQMQVSNDAAFSGASWQAYQTSLIWGITPGTGMRSVYVRFRDSAGNITSYQSQITVRVYTFIPQVER